MTSMSSDARFAVPGRSVPPRADEGRTVPFILAAIAASVACFALLIYLAIVAPRFENVFRDFGTTLPFPVRCTFFASNWLMGSSVGQVVPGWLIAVPILLGTGATLWKMGANRRVRHLATLLLALAALFIFTAILVSGAGMYTTLTVLISSMQNTTP